MTIAGISINAIIVVLQNVVKLNMADEIEHLGRTS